MRTLLLLLMVLTLIAPARADAPPAGFGAYLSIRAASSPSVSPDGKNIVYTSNTSGTWQAWGIGARGGATAQLTRYEDRIAFIDYTPDGKQLIFGKDNKGDERTQLYLSNLSGTEVVPLTENPRAIHGYGGVSRDGAYVAYTSNERNQAFFDVYVMDLATRKARRVLENDATWSVQRWNPGGASLIIKKQESNVNNTLYELDLVGGRLRELTPHSGDASYDNVNWPEGSEWVYLTTDQDREFSGLARLHVKTAKLERLAETKWDVTDLLVSSKGRWAAWITNEDSYSRLRVGTLAELSRPDAVAVVAMPGGVGDTLSFSEDEAVLAFAWAAATQPSDIWALNPGAGTTTWQVTHSSLAGLDPKKFVAPTLVRFPTFDGRQIPALLFKPAGDPPAAGFPVVLAIHGGPEAQEQPWFSTVYQFLLSRGFAVLAPNIRGSTGYGRTYVHLDDSRKRGDAIEDVAWAVKYVGTVPGLNARRVAVMGGSYGGYMTLAALTFHPSLFAAGVDIVGIANFETFLANTGPWRRKLRIAEYGDPEKDLEYLRKFSPIHKVDLIEAPLMVIHGRQDPRVPLSEAEQIVKSLQTRGRPVEFLLFDDEGHGLAKIQNRQKAYSAVADFLDKHLKAP